MPCRCCSTWWDWYPALGAPADVLNGLISAARGDWLGAGLSLLGVVPVAGEAATVGKIAKNSEKYLNALTGGHGQGDSASACFGRHASWKRPSRQPVSKIDEIAGKKPETAKPPAKAGS